MLLLFVVCSLLSVSPVIADEATGLSESVTFLLKEVSQDMAVALSSSEKALAGFSLASSDIKNRVVQIGDISKTAVEDAARFGYSEQEGEAYLQLLTDINTAYSSYEALLQSYTVRREQVSGLVSSGDLEATLVSSIVSTDINAHDEARKTLEKYKQGIEMQIFFLKSSINKIDLYLSDVAQGEEAIQTMAELPESEAAKKRFQELKLELAKVKLASTIQGLLDGQLRNEELIYKVKESEKILSYIRGKLSFDESALKENIANIQKQIDEEKVKLSDAREKLSSAAASLEKARQLVSGDVSASSPMTRENSLYLERRANLNHWEYFISLTQDNLGYLTESQEIWKARYDMFNDNTKGDDLWKYRNESKAKIAELKARLESVQALQNDYYNRLSTVQAQIEEAEGKTKQNLNQMAKTLQNTVTNVLNRYAYILPRQSLLQQMLYEEAGARMGTVRIAEQVGSFSKKTFLSFLNTELWRGEGYSVTVGKLITAVLILFSSFFLSSMGSKLIQRTLLRRFSSDVTAANATQRVIFYILWFSFFLIALQTVRIPLTAFAFMGGAVALAIGFGAQNLFNNLISGFIIMFSRPFRVNDVVEVDGVSGSVEEIGSRSTRIRTWDNMEVIMPNRYLLENRVTNWMGSDTKIRSSIRVGVGYDADTRVVEELLLKMAKTHSRVLKEPQPFVLFDNFGDSALQFTLYFWVDIVNASAVKVSSDIRHHLVSTFRNEGITIPYPRMDIQIPAPGFAAQPDSRNV